MRYFIEDRGTKEDTAYWKVDSNGHIWIIEPTKTRPFEAIDGWQKLNLYGKGEILYRLEMWLDHNIPYDESEFEEVSEEDMNGMLVMERL